MSADTPPLRRAAGPVVRPPRTLAHVVVLSWAFILLTFLLFRYEFPLLATLPCGILIGFFGLVAFGMSYRELLSRRGPGVSRPLMIVTALWLVWLLAPVHRLGIYERAFRQASQYEAVARRILESNMPRGLEAEGCFIEPGPPRYVAFPWDGMGDNWFGIVFVPSEETLDEEARRELFGVELVYAHHLWGHLYFCSFK